MRTWNDTPNEEKLTILDELRDNKKSPLQVLLDAGIAPSDHWVKELKRADDLSQRMKAKLPQLEEWIAEAEDEWSEEDGVYRFYHQSWKVFDRLQPLTEAGFQLIVNIGGETDRPMNGTARSTRKAESASSTIPLMSAGLNAPARSLRPFGTPNISFR
jgi:hypothetical protein